MEAAPVLGSELPVKAKFSLEAEGQLPKEVAGPFSVPATEEALSAGALKEWYHWEESPFLESEISFGI